MSNTFILFLVLLNFALAATFIAIMLSMCQAAKHGDEVIESHFPAGSSHTMLSLESLTPPVGHLHSQETDRQPGVNLNRKKHSLARWLEFHHALK